jgi:hypothetical protein
MGVSPRNQRQVHSGDVNKQRGDDTDDANPKAPIFVRSLPVGTMNMQFVMVIVFNLMH